MLFSHLERYTYAYIPNMDSALHFLASEPSIITCLDLALLCHPAVAFLSIQRSKMHSTTSRWQYILFSFLAILALRCVTAQENATTSALPAPLCQSQDQPNPIATTYPHNATGVLNGTISVIPIPMAQARKIIPSQYGILEHAIQAQLPGFPKDMYPVLIQAMHDHDISAMGFNVPDFSVSNPFNQPTMSGNSPTNKPYSVLVSSSPSSTY